MVRQRRSTQPQIHPEARPLRAGTGPIGVVVSHGFTGSVASVAPWARGLAAAADDWPGVRVVAPRLPGHGTHWRDLARTRWWDWYGAVEDAWAELDDSCERVFVAGLSMGGALALVLAARQPVAGVLLVNPSIATLDRRVAPAARAHRVVPAQRGIASDIAKEGVTELGYQKFSVTSLASLTELWAEARAGLSRVKAPTLLMRSRIDHVVDKLSGDIIESAVRNVRSVELPNSYHVATLDHDADLIVAESRQFIRGHADGRV